MSLYHIRCDVRIFYCLKSYIYIYYKRLKFGVSGRCYVSVYHWLIKNTAHKFLLHFNSTVARLRRWRAIVGGETITYWDRWTLGVADTFFPAQQWSDFSRNVVGLESDTGPIAAGFHPWLSRKLTGRGPKSGASGAWPLVPDFGSDFGRNPVGIQSRTNQISMLANLPPSTDQNAVGGRPPAACRARARVGVGRATLCIPTFQASNGCNSISRAYGRLRSTHARRRCPY